MKWLARSLSTQQLERLVERLQALDGGTSVSSQDGEGEVDVVVLDGASEEELSALRAWRDAGRDTIAVIVVEGGARPPDLAGLLPVVLVGSGWLDSEGELERCLAQIAALEVEQRRVRDLEIQLRQAEEEKFQLQIRNEELDRLLAAGDSDEPLTGLRSERSMARSVEEAFNLARRHQTPVACLLIGIDDYAGLEDRFGGGFTDYIVEQISHRVKTCMRNTDLLSRYQPGELLMLSPFASREGATAVGERLREAVAMQRLEHEGRRLELSVSVGIATFSLDMQSSAELVETAAAALDEARRTSGLHVV